MAGHMSHENDTDDGEDGPKTHRDYRIARDRTGRLSKPEDAGPRDPAAEMCEEHGIGSGFSGLEGDGDVSKSAQETLDDALADWDPMGTDPVVKENARETLGSIDWEAELEYQRKSEKDLLRDILHRLETMDRTTPAAEQAVADALQKANTEKGGTNATDLLGEIEDALERQEGLPEAAKTTIEEYVEQGGSLRDGLGDFAQFLRENLADAEGDVENHDRARALASLASLENTAEDGQTPA